MLKTINPLVTNYTTLFLLHVNKLCRKQLEKKVVKSVYFTKI